MKKALVAMLTLNALVISATAVRADTLYVSVPNAAAPGHPLRLANDRRAAQAGDLVSVQFNFNVNQASTNATSNAKTFGLGVTPGAGLFGIAPLNLPTSFGGNSSASKTHTAAATQTFATTMMATVSDVLPSGNFVITGDQKLVVNGIAQTLHVVGTIRPDDIDSTDTVLSSRVSNVSAEFKGDTPKDNNGIIKKILDALF